MEQSSTRSTVVPPDHSSAALSDQGSDLLRLLSLLWNGRWVIGSFTLLAILIGGYYAFAVASAQYTATARLVMEQRQSQVVDLDTVLSGVSTDSAALNTELQYILSRKLIERVVDDLDLVSDPEFNATLREPPGFSFGQVKARIRALILGPPPPLPAPSPEKIREATVNAVRNTISVSTQRNTYIFMVRSTTGNPETSARIANRLAQTYIDNQVEKKFSATEYAVNWLTERVTELEAELKGREDEIKQLRSATDLINVEALDALNIRAKELRDRLSKAETTIETATDRLTNARSLVESGEIAEIAAFFADPTLDTLQRRISTQGGETGNRSLFDDRVAALISNLERKIARGTAQRDALGASLDTLQKQIAEQTEDLSRLTRMQRDVEATRILYETFLTRLKETSIQIGLQQADAAILSEAIRGQQVAPRRSRILVISMVLGALLGTGIILLRLVLHNQYRSATELERATGVAVIGNIPRIPIHRRKSLVHYLRGKPTSAMAEAIRNMRTSILLSDIDHPPQIIMSTSSLPGEGKTTQSISLAQNLSGLGKRVLLIECDIRRHTFAHYFKATNPHGLFAAVSGEVQTDQAISHDEELGADIICGDTAPVNAADVFSSERFRSFLEYLRSKYDYIVIDTPPVLMVPDARIIGQQCDAIIYSVKWDSTNKDQVAEGLQQLFSVGLKPTGLVLSQIDVRRMKSYGYAGYAGYAAYAGKYYDT